MAESGHIGEGGIWEGEWQSIQNSSGRVPSRRYASASCVVGDELFVFGGAAGTDGYEEPRDDFWTFSFEDSVWEEVDVLSEDKPVRQPVSRWGDLVHRRTERVRNVI